jgi:hypothetical protein
MASIISAGTTSGTALNMAGDTSGILQLATNGSTTAITIDTSQNVGIGTASPANVLQAAKSQTADTAIVVSNAGTANAATTMSFVLAESTTPQGWFRRYRDGTGVTEIGYSDVLTFSGNVTGTKAERMRITSGGAVLVGDPATGAYFDGNLNVFKSGNIPLCVKIDTVSAWNISCWSTPTSGNNAFLVFGTEGTFNARGSITYNRGSGLTAYNTTSDERLKDNIVDASSALSKIDSVKIRSFDWKETGNHVDFGVIAQELISVAPECVTEGQDNEDGTMKTSWSVDTSALVPALVKAIQEQQTIINDLKARITALEGAA